MLEGGSHVLAGLIGWGTTSLQRALSIFFVLFLLRLVLRRERTALVVMGILGSLLGMGGENVALETPFAVLNAVLIVWTIGRFGLLAGAAMWFYRILLSAAP